MFTYKGKNLESGKKIKKEFLDEYEAIEYARENAYDYPKFKVTDIEGDIIDSSKMANKERQETLNDMGLLDDETSEGFDVNDFFEKD